MSCIFRTISLSVPFCFFILGWMRPNRLLTDRNCSAGVRCCGPTSLICLLCIVETKTGASQSFASRPPVACALVCVSLCGCILHFAAVVTQRSTKKKKKMADCVENPHEWSPDLLSCSTGFELLRSRSHVSCHAPLEINVLIFNTVTFVITPKLSTDQQHAGLVSVTCVNATCFNTTARRDTCSKAEWDVTASCD